MQSRPSGEIAEYGTEPAEVEAELDEYLKELDL